MILLPWHHPPLVQPAAAAVALAPTVLPLASLLPPRLFSRASSSTKPAMGVGRSVSASSHTTAARSDSSKEGVCFTNISDDEWKSRLNEEQYYVTRKKGTERAFTGQYWNTKTPGVYHCVCCDTPLFDYKTKFDSGTGWPSYYEPVGSNVKSEMDWSIPFMPRTEVMCANCDAHLGHVFNDGPPPTGKRYCINSASLVFKPNQQ